MDASVLFWRRIGRGGRYAESFRASAHRDRADLGVCPPADLSVCTRSASDGGTDGRTCAAGPFARPTCACRGVSAYAAVGRAGRVHRAEQLARRSGVTIEGIVLHAPREEEEIVIRPVELKFYGGYFQILDFLRAVQEDERAVQFGSFVLTTQAHELHCTLTVNVASLHGENDEEQLPPVRRGDRGE